MNVDPRTLIALVALLAVTLASSLLQAPVAHDAGLLLLGVGVGMAIRSYWCGRW